MKKIVVLAGSFNPVTKAHFLALQNAVNLVNADKGLFVLVNKDYLRKKMVIQSKIPSSFQLSEEVRKEMIDSLSKEDPRIGFGCFELGKGSPSTERTLRKIAKDNPGSEIYFLSGADKIKSIPNWKDFDRLMTNMHILVIKRKDIDIDSIINADPRLLKYKDRIDVISEVEGLKDASSTKVRELFFAGEDYSHLMNRGPYEIMSRFTPSDFPAVKPSDIISAHLEVGGRFGGNAARMVVFKTNNSLFKNWREDVFGKKDDIFSNTKLYKNPFTITRTESYSLKTSVANIDCVEAAETLVNEGLKPAILNFASQLIPCGSYREGGTSQEESLCQASNLSVSLFQFAKPNLKVIKELGIPHKDGYPLDTPDSGVYSKGITFFRNNLDKQYSYKIKPFKCDVITIASLANHSATDYTNDGTEYFEENGHLTTEGISIQSEKIRTVFRIALDNGNDSLVLGAFGCGAYRVLPEDMANLFESVLLENEFRNAFKNIVFAIYEGKPNHRSKKVVGPAGKYKVFYDKFNR